MRDAMKRGVWLLILALPLLFSCASITRKGVEGYQTDGNTQIGIASWYGDQEHGNNTASGERFSKYDYTAAHKTLPIGTMDKMLLLELMTVVRLKRGVLLTFRMLQPKQ